METITCLLFSLLLIVAQEQIIHFVELVRRFRTCSLMVDLLLQSVQIATLRLLLDHLPILGRTDIVRVLPERSTAKGSLENLHRIHYESWSDLGQGAIFGQDLEVAEPNAFVEERKRVDMIEEGLRFRMVIGHTECLNVHFLEQRQMGKRIELWVERQQRSGTTQAISRQLQFAHCVDVFDEELGRWSFGDVREPHVEIPFATTLEQDGLIAVLHFAHIVDDGQGLGTFHFGVWPVMGHQHADVLH